LQVQGQKLLVDKNQIPDYDDVLRITWIKMDAFGWRPPLTKQFTSGKQIQDIPQTESFFFQVCQWAPLCSDNEGNKWFVPLARDL